MFKKFYDKQLIAFTLLLSACAAGITGCGSKADSSAPSEIIMESSDFSDTSVSSETASTAASEAASTAEISETTEATDMPEVTEPTEVSSEADLDNISDPTVALATETASDTAEEVQHFEKK